MPVLQINVDLLGALFVILHNAQWLLVMCSFRASRLQQLRCHRHPFAINYVVLSTKHEVVDSVPTSHWCAGLVNREVTPTS